MLAQTGLMAGAAQRVITPPVGALLAGYASRASGDLRSRYVHDDLYVKALVLRARSKGWALVAADVIGLDAIAVGRIRRAVAVRTDLAPEAILFCATHTHAAPPPCAIAGAIAPENLNAVRSDGKVMANYGQLVSTLSPTAYFAAEVDPDWKAWMVDQAIEAAVSGWEACRPAEMAHGAIEVAGVASSRRVLLSDGTWADPRRDMPAGVTVVSRTEVDPMARVLAVRERHTEAPIAALVNYGTHPWVFNTSGISAELAGAVARQVAAEWAPAGEAPPVVLYTTGPQGDVTLIWNIDLDKVWRMAPGESLEVALPRRERGFDGELARLGARVSTRVISALGSLTDWDGDPPLAAARRELLLPLKPGYRRPPEILLDTWQRGAPVGHHRTELQLLRAGRWALLGLPGEPFTALGQAIRAGSPQADLMLAAVANDYGPVSYLARPADFDQGGYELMVTPAAPAAGEVLVQESVALLAAQAGGEAR